MRKDFSLLGEWPSYTRSGFARRELWQIIKAGSMQPATPYIMLMNE